MTRVILAMPGNEAMAGAIAERLDAHLGDLEVRRFPDEESYVRIASRVKGCDVLIVCTLARPDSQFVALVFVAETARALGATSVGLIAPYMAYLRQDKSFCEGEAVSARYFARLLSGVFDAVVTIDPHLHRIVALDEVFETPTLALSAAPLLASWIKTHVADPLIVGPDSESEQWAGAIAASIGAPHIVLSKQRLGDHRVVLELPDLSAWGRCKPVLIDDIVSSGTTALEAARLLQMQGFDELYCLVVHALCDAAVRARVKESFARFVSTDTVPHPTNAIGVAGLIAGALDHGAAPA